MSANRSRTRWAALLLAFFAGQAAANTILITDDELDAGVFPVVAESIRANLDLLASRDLPPARRRVVLRSLENMERYFDEDPEGHRWRIGQERLRINSMLAPAIARNHPDAQVVCQRVKRIGTHIRSTRCMTRIEMELEQHAAVSLLTTPNVNGGARRD